jgi:hypothetical protein
MDDPALQEKLALYHKAIEEEFALVQRAVKEGSQTAIAEAARKVLLERTAEAARTITFLAEHAQSESIRLNASKYILDNAIGTDSKLGVNDPLYELVRELSPAKQ